MGCVYLNRGHWIPKFRAGAYYVCSIMFSSHSQYGSRVLLKIRSRVEPVGILVLLLVYRSTAVKEVHIIATVEHLEVVIRNRWSAT